MDQHTIGYWGGNLVHQLLKERVWILHRSMELWHRIDCQNDRLHVCPRQRRRQPSLRLLPQLGDRHVDGCLQQCGRHGCGHKSLHEGLWVAQGLLKLLDAVDELKCRPHVVPRQGRRQLGLLQQQRLEARQCKFKCNRAKCSCRVAHELLHKCLGILDRLLELILRVNKPCGAFDVAPRGIVELHAQLAEVPGEHRA